MISLSFYRIVIELTKFAQYNNMIVLLKDVDDDGNTALHLSSTEGRFSTTKALIAAGTDPNIRYIYEVCVMKNYQVT